MCPTKMNQMIKSPGSVFLWNSSNHPRTAYRAGNSIEGEKNTLFSLLTTGNLLCPPCNYSGTAVIWKAV